MTEFTFLSACAPVYVFRTVTIDIGTLVAAVIIAEVTRSCTVSGIVIEGQINLHTCCTRLTRYVYRVDWSRVIAKGSIMTGLTHDVIVTCGAPLDMLLMSSCIWVSYATASSRT